MASAQPRAIAVDFNGTLSHDEPLLCSIYRELFAEHGRPLSEDDYYGRLAGGSEEAIIGGWLGVEGDELASLVEERVERYRRAADGSTIAPAAREAMRYAAERVPLALVSGACRREVEPVLAAAGISSLFRVLVTADDVTLGKPHPEGYLLAVELLGGGLRPEEVVALEDTEAGVASAKAAGLQCVAVLGTLPPERLRAADELAPALDVELVRRLLG